MKTKKLNLVKLPVIALIAMVSITACEKDNADTPEYVGSWISTQSITEEDITLQVRDELTFTGNGFTQFAKILSPFNNQWIDFMELKGSITVDEGKMNITVEEIGMSSMNDATGLPTGDLSFYKKSHSEFHDLLQVLGIDKSFKAEYNISGDKMILKSDDNNDGDFDDDDEEKVYTRQRISINPGLITR